jgi:uncharacterized protein YdhG (YjbR/CyaY superfamily)
MKLVKDVDEYIAGAPKDTQARLKAVRSAIRSAAPKAEERISYGMPYYHYKGRLVYFQLWKKHIGLYAIGAPILKEHKSELKDRVANKGTVRFPLDEKLPIALIKKLVKAQVKMKDEAAKKK